ncbi:hypothetical protein KY385_03110 [Candidatus Parcubacteria bacterium]|nr:hypothetical protein [Candidatus Parcubacteria bacterium]
MINKLIANLAFSPNLIEGIDFYTKRLNQESSIRKLGLIFIVLAMLVQMFAAAVPPEKSLAQSPDNDVIVGGVSSMGQLQSKCYSHSNVRALFARFGLACGEIETNKVLSGGVDHININFNFQYQGSQGTRTVGRTNYNHAGTNNLGSFNGTTYFSRPANVWNGGTPAYFLGKHKGTDNNYYYVWIIKDCGNIAYRPAPSPPSPSPAPAPKPTPAAAPVPAPVPIPAVAPVVTAAAPVPVPAEPVTCKDTSSCKPPELDKEARNITQNLSSRLTSSTKARAGDVIEYTLTTANKNEVELVKYDIEDNIGDILDYADIDKSFLSEQGGSFSADKKTVAWTDQTIAANSSSKKVFRVKMKNPLPATNQPNATAPDFDCRMENSYGAPTVIQVDCAVVKAVETLPNTGPGETIGATFAVTFISSYFFARSRLLAKELKFIKKDHKFAGRTK